MKNNIFANKKIGIWGFGIVGQSVFKHIQQYTNHIQILDRTAHANNNIILETPENIKKFLEYNQIIIPSPGIVLSNYQNYAHKFVQELDIFSQDFQGRTIAVTGTVGKTTVTSLLAQAIPHAIAAGNIGYAMLNTLNLKPKPEIIVLELSSYQLQCSKYYAPDMAIWTNFFPNHLDHHQNEQEYFQAKCKMLEYQHENQVALLPYNLIKNIQKVITPKAQIYLFDEGIDFQLQNNQQESIPYPVFFIQNNQLLLKKNDQTIIIFHNIDQLCDITFIQNWLVIIAGLYLQNFDLNHFKTYTQTLKPEPHRCEFVKNLNGVAVYNDSKSTVWQATQCAVDKFSGKKIALFLGGMSKGTDRTPLFKHITNKPITVFAFGKEAELLAGLSQKYNISHFQAATLEESFQQYLKLHNNFEVLLFSPAGASFDLFKNFEDRGEQFKKMIQNL